MLRLMLLACLLSIGSMQPGEYLTKLWHWPCEHTSYCIMFYLQMTVHQYPVKTMTPTVHRICTAVTNTSANQLSNFSVENSTCTQVLPQLIVEHFTMKELTRLVAQICLAIRGHQYLYREETSTQMPRSPLSGHELPLTTNQVAEHEATHHVADAPLRNLRARHRWRSTLFFNWVKYEFQFNNPLPPMDEICE